MEYEILIQGMVSQSMIKALGNFRHKQLGAICLLTGVIRDQSELMGVIHRINSYRMNLIGIHPAGMQWMDEGSEPTDHFKMMMDCEDRKKYQVRQATAADQQAVMELNRIVHQDEDVAMLVQDLFEGKSPGIGAEQFLVAENLENQKIASSLTYQPKHLCYDGIELRAGVIELVGTMPEDRGRGLVRAMMAEAHQMSNKRGDHLRLILGIPHFYRQFGYGMALEADYHARVRLEDDPMPPAAESARPLALRPVDEADLDWVTAFTARETRRELVSPVISKALWRYELIDHHPRNVNRRDWYVIEQDGEALGLLSFRVEEQTGMIYYCEVDTTRSAWAGFTPRLLALLRGRFGFEQLQLNLYSAHPLARALASRLEKEGHYAWYVDIPDLAVFLNAARPALDRRLASSPYSAYSGDVIINTYRQRLRMTIESGTVTAVEPDQEASESAAKLSIAEDMVPAFFLGQRSLSEIRELYPETYSTQFPDNLLETLFPKGHAMMQVVI
ncbi:MAG: GNAT family N-acetyltransferase [Anaerolineaceae bacterium]|nr:GNAT family N-acetyltransferase [Anaerolineaceae bacterium]